MININELPVNVLWKGDRVNFSIVGSKTENPNVCLVTHLGDQLNIKTQMVHMDTINNADIELAPCSEDISKTCDFIMPYEISHNGMMSMYCCHLCAMRREVMRELEFVENKEDPGTVADLMKFKKSVLSTDTYFTKDEIADIENRIDTIIKKRES